MRRILGFGLTLAAFAFVFVACNNDDDDAACPTPNGNATVDAAATEVVINWDEPGTAWNLEYGASGFTQGSGTTVSVSSFPYTLSGLEANTAYEFYLQRDCGATNSDFAGPFSFSTVSPLIGTWEAYDVSPLLAGTGVTAITAVFNADNTYAVTSTSGGADVNLQGTYTITADANAEGIYAIELNQTSPNSLTTEGIFKIYEASPDSMWYEVAQTDPAITGVTAPTQDGGFGSTSGGAFGETNIQKYNRVEN